MKQYTKKNKVLKLLIILTIIILIIDIFIPALLSNTINKEIKLNIKHLLVQVKENKQIVNTTPFLTYTGNILTIVILWLLGISIIGIPIILLFYSIKSLNIFLETILLLKNIKLCNILFIIIYSIQSLAYLLILLIIVYYACNYSIILIKTLFMKKDYSIKRITYNYLKILLIMVILTTIYTTLDIILIPKLLRLVI